MLINSARLNAVVIGSGAPNPFVYGIASTVAQIVSDARGTVLRFGSATQDVTVRTIKRFASATQFVQASITAVGRSYRLASGSASQFVEATTTAVGTRLQQVLGRATGYASVDIRARGRYGTKGSATGEVRLATSAVGWVTLRGVATQNVAVVGVARAYDIPTGYAPEERSCILAYEDRSFTLPKD